MKIPVHHYVEITSEVRIAGIASDYYIANEGGKQYLVEVWA